MELENNERELRLAHLCQNYRRLVYGLAPFAARDEVVGPTLREAIERLETEANKVGLPQINTGMPIFAAPEFGVYTLD